MYDVEVHMPRAYPPMTPTRQVLRNFLLNAPQLFHVRYDLTPKKPIFVDLEPKDGIGVYTNTMYMMCGCQRRPCKAWLEGDLLQIKPMPRTEIRYYGNLAIEGWLQLGVWLGQCPECKQIYWG